jgi:hypothetical protein
MGLIEVIDTNLLFRASQDHPEALFVGARALKSPQLALGWLEGAEGGRYWPRSHRKDHLVLLGPTWQVCSGCLSLSISTAHCPPLLPRFSSSYHFPSLWRPRLVFFLFLFKQKGKSTHQRHGLCAMYL